MKETRGYWEQSLAKLKEDVAEKAGDIADATTGKLSKAYGVTASDTGLYDRLLLSSRSLTRAGGT